MAHTRRTQGAAMPRAPQIGQGTLNEKLDEARGRNAFSVPQIPMELPANRQEFSPKPAATSPRSSAMPATSKAAQKQPKLDQLRQHARYTRRHHQKVTGAQSPPAKTPPTARTRARHPSEVRTPQAVRSVSKATREAKPPPSAATQNAIPLTSANRATCPSLWNAPAMPLSTGPAASSTTAQQR